MPTPKEQILFLLILSGQGQLHASEYLSDLGARLGDSASTEQADGKRRRPESRW
jgi:hypothetical protein